MLNLAYADIFRDEENRVLILVTSDLRSILRVFDVFCKSTALTI